VRRMIASKYRMTLSGCMQRMIASRYRMTCHCVKMKHVVLCHCPAWNKPCCNSETKHTGYAAQQRCCCLAMWQLTQSLYPVIRLSGENINFRAQELEKAGSPSLCLWPSHNFSCTISIKSHTHKKILPWSYYSAHKALLPLWINCFLLVCLLFHKECILSSTIHATPHNFAPFSPFLFRTHSIVQSISLAFLSTQCL